MERTYSKKEIEEGKLDELTYEATHLLNEIGSVNDFAIQCVALSNEYLKQAQEKGNSDQKEVLEKLSKEYLYQINLILNDYGSQIEDVYSEERMKKEDK